MNAKYDTAYVLQLSQVRCLNPTLAVKAKKAQASIIFHNECGRCAVTEFGNDADF